jgi:hypothetical protein
MILLETVECRKPRQFPLFEDVHLPDVITAQLEFGGVGLDCDKVFSH